MKNLSKFLTCTGLVMALALTGCNKGEINLNENAKSVTELSIPEGVKIVGLGEASHGNKEFQELMDPDIQPYQCYDQNHKVFS